MKMSSEDRDMLKKALMETLTVHKLHPFMVQNTACAWQVFHKAWAEARLDGNALYSRYNDNHIETALRSIFL